MVAERSPTERSELETSQSRKRGPMARSEGTPMSDRDVRALREQLADAAAEVGQFEAKLQAAMASAVAAAAAPNQGAVVGLDKFPLAASPLLLATHEK